jgi:enoyl-CoA hydratase
MSYELILIDNPRPLVRRITLNRPDKRNALNNQLRAEILTAVEEADRDPEVRVSILRGSGGCFSAGYDLGMNNTKGQPYYTAGGIGNWSRHAIEGSFRIWDWPSLLLPRCMAIAWPGRASSPPPAILSTLPKTRKSAIRRCV